MLVVYKRTTYERYGGARAGRVHKLVEDRDPSVRLLLESHDAHHRTIAGCRTALRALGAEARFVHLLRGVRTERFDLVVTLGGDGTLLTASHAVGRDTPVVAINSAPMSSMGFFSAGDGDAAASILRDALLGRLPTTSLSRMRLDVDGKTFHRRVLNDVLFCHQNPAAATRYVLQHGDVIEEQLSSGIWVGPAAGSTAAQRSAGGRELPAASRKLQFVVREPYHGRGQRYRLTRGLVADGDALSIRSQIREGMLYVDGHDLTRKVDIGSEVRLFRSDEPLQLLGLRR